MVGQTHECGETKIIEISDLSEEIESVRLICLGDMKEKQG